MDFTLSEDEEALRDGMRARLAGRWSMAHIRSLEHHAGVDRDGWRDLGAAGLFALRLPEGAGGLGLGHAAAALLFEELGRALVPGPLVASHLAAGAVDGAAAGECVVGALDTGDDPLLIEHRDGLDRLVVVGPGALTVVDPAALPADALDRPLDPLTPLHRLRGGVPAVLAGETIGGPDEARQWKRDAALLTAALQLGIAGAVTDLSVDYAKRREQFGKPIGGFQAVKHLLADMFVRVEMARAAVYAAAVTVDDPAVGEPTRAVAGAKLLAGEAALANAKTAVQVHGGMGFTWEVDVHLYLKRAWVYETAWGTGDDHAEALAALA